MALRHRHSMVSHDVFINAVKPKRSFMYKYHFKLTSTSFPVQIFAPTRCFTSVLRLEKWFLTLHQHVNFRPWVTVLEVWDSQWVTVLEVWDGQWVTVLEVWDVQWVTVLEVWDSQWVTVLEVWDSQWVTVLEVWDSQWVTILANTNQYIIIQCVKAKGF